MNNNALVSQLKFVPRFRACLCTYTLRLCTASLCITYLCTPFNCTASLVSFSIWLLHSANLLEAVRISILKKNFFQGWQTVDVLYSEYNFIHQCFKVSTVHCTLPRLLHYKPILQQKTVHGTVSGNTTSFYNMLCCTILGNSTNWLYHYQQGRFRDPSW